MLVHSSAPLRKKMRVPRTVERSMEFSVMDWPICSASVKVSSPVYKLSASKWRFTLLCPETDDDTDVLHVEIENLADETITSSITGGVVCLTNLPVTLTESMKSLNSGGVDGDKDVVKSGFLEGPGGYAIEPAFVVPLITLHSREIMAVSIPALDSLALESVQSLTISVDVVIYDMPQYCEGASEESLHTGFESTTNTLGSDIGRLLLKHNDHHEDPVALITANRYNRENGSSNGSSSKASPDSRADRDRQSAQVPSTSTSTSSPNKATYPSDNLHLTALAQTDITSFSDITLVCGERHFHAHKCILAARSTVFAKKLTRVATNVSLFFKGQKLQIEGIHVSVFAELLSYMYTDQVSKLALAQFALPLLVAAHRYEVTGLVSKCEDMLMETVFPDVAANYLMLASRLGLKSFEERCSEYIACHLPEVSALDSSYNSLGGEQCRALIDRASAKGLSGFVGQGGHNKPIDIESQSQKDIPKAALQLQLPSPIALSPSSQHCSPPNAPGKSAIARAGEKRFGVRLQPVTERDSEMDNTGPGTGNGPLKPTAAAQGKKGQGQGGKAKGKYMEESKDANLDPQDDIPYNSARTNVTSSGDE